MGSVWSLDVPPQLQCWEFRSQGYSDNFIPMLNVLVCHSPSQRTQTFELRMLVTPPWSHFVQFTNRPVVTVLASSSAGLGPSVGVCRLLSGAAHTEKASKQAPAATPPPPEPQNSLLQPQNALIFLSLTVCVTLDHLGSDPHSRRKPQGGAVSPLQNDWGFCFSHCQPQTGKMTPRAGPVPRLNKSLPGSVYVSTSEKWA